MGTWVWYFRGVVQWDIWKTVWRYWIGNGWFAVILQQRRLKIYWLLRILYWPNVTQLVSFRSPNLDLLISRSSSPFMREIYVCLAINIFQKMWNDGMEPMFCLLLDEHMHRRSQESEGMLAREAYDRTHHLNTSSASGSSLAGPSLKVSSVWSCRVGFIVSSTCLYYNRAQAHYFLK